MITEADTCRKYVLPKLYAAGWNDDQISEQKSFTDGRIVPVGEKARRRYPKRADYLLRYTRDLTIAVIEAKAAYKLPGDGLQQAKEYAQMLGLNFAYSTNGHGIVEFDFITGKEQEIDTFPSPEQLWKRLRRAAGLDDDQIAGRALTPADTSIGKGHRYYQEIAINRTVQAILKGDKRVLLTMATGTGKTVVAFQICWKLWSMRWNRTGEHRRPKILYLADRNILIDDPKDKIFAPFGDARWKIENGEVNKGREMYFAIYQAIAKDERRPGLYREFGPNFFDLIIVDECHRGSAQDDSNWREILKFFEPAYQLGMTATPLRKDNRNTYRYFGKPLYTSDLAQRYPDYVCRITSEEGDIGHGHLSKFQELETLTPTIVTTSQLLTTGVDVPTCKNVVIARVINSMVEFKQIIGRGTRVRDDYGKFFFNILDYTGSATLTSCAPLLGKPTPTLLICSATSPLALPSVAAASAPTSSVKRRKTSLKSILLRQEPC